jgi:hypothetical protein
MKTVAFKDLQSKYPDSWVLIENPTFQANSTNLLGGIFHYKNKNQSKVYKKAIELGLKNITVRYTGGKLEEKDYIFVL